MTPSVTLTHYASYSNIYDNVLYEHWFKKCYVTICNPYQQLMLNFISQPNDKHFHALVKKICARNVVIAVCYLQINMSRSKHYQGLSTTGISDFTKRGHSNSSRINIYLTLSCQLDIGLTSDPELSVSAFPLSAKRRFVNSWLQIMGSTQIGETIHQTDIQLLSFYCLEYAKYIDPMSILRPDLL